MGGDRRGFGKQRGEFGGGGSVRFGAQLGGEDGKKGAGEEKGVNPTTKGELVVLHPKRECSFVFAVVHNAKSVVPLPGSTCGKKNCT